MIAAVVTASSLSCVRYARFEQRSTRTGTCEGACRHYVGCKDDGRPEAFGACMADCSDIFVYDGEVDEESLMVFEGLDCRATIAYVDGRGGERAPAGHSDQGVKVRSQAH